MSSSRILGFLLGASILAVAADAYCADAGCGSGLACEMCDVTGYSPTEMAAPIGPNAGACSSDDISAFDTACLATTATAQTCQTWQSSASSACLNCLFTASTASSWGFLVCDTTGSCSVNTGGCVDLELSQTSMEKNAGGSGSCGDAVNANFGCQDYACGSCSDTDFDTCDQSAIANECASYVAPVDSTTGPCASLNGDGGTPAAICFPQTDTDDVTMATYMCGGAVSPPSDGGTTGGDGGVTTKKDGGSVTDGGSGDGGTSSSSGGGCHCDAAGAGGGSNGALGLMSVGAFVAFAVGRRRRRVNRP